ncbi:ABC transporter ATP-binding protein [Nitratireductor sp. ZSWI3]|uniref:ABC transporter ATP-binding protein n=1 Tax=Nitratireductor sp. ZSWI3 TaxID=2966359 RepID=UPI00214F6CF9|nr:ABC transporter ATP-binding protein [Nitratireductor sp. ZSWI3]MCR4266646.1 ABC transporter ATP-binding protein [Nitratireductor sp. ZSWI3]
MNGLGLSGVELRFGGLRVLRGIDLAIEASGITALIGPNGAGKTSLVNVVTAAYRPSAGKVVWEGRAMNGIPPHHLPRLGIARTFQNLEIFWTMSVIDNVMAAAQGASPPRLIPSLLKAPHIVRAETLSRATALVALERVGLLDQADREAGELSYGHLKRLEIARALALQPRLLLLDEPAAGCNPNETGDLAALIRGLADGGLGVLLIEHDMKMVMSISDRVLVMDRGVIIADGPPGKVRNDPVVVAAYLGPGTGAEAVADPDRMEARA